MDIYISILTRRDNSNTGLMESDDPLVNCIAHCGMLALTPKLQINKIITLENEETILLSMERLFNDLTPHQIYVDDYWVYDIIRDRSIAHGIATHWANGDNPHLNRFQTMSDSSWIPTEERLSIVEMCRLMGIPSPYGGAFYTGQIQRSCMAMSMINLRRSYQRGTLSRLNYTKAADRLLNTYMELPPHTEWTSSFSVDGKRAYILE